MSNVSLMFYLRSENELAYDGRLLRETSSNIICEDFAISKYVFTNEKQYDLVDAFNSTSRYLDDLLNIDNILFEHMVHRIYPTELKLNKGNASDTEAVFRLKPIDS